MKFTFQLFSDLHQEFLTNFYKIPPISDYLFLAGDIHNISKSNFKQFIDYISNNWKQVFYVPGNHEYYNRFDSLYELKKHYELFFQDYTNVHFLDDDISTINYNDKKIIIIGSTLWSNVTKTDGINDFKNILQKSNEYISREEFNILHEKSFKFIKEQVDTIQNVISDEKIIIMTHFPPTPENTTDPKYINEKLYIKQYFAPNILNIFNSNNIKCWIHGHTHYSNDFIDNDTGIRVLSNQLGYLQEIKQNKYCPKMKEDGLFEIEL